MLYDPKLFILRSLFAQFNSLQYDRLLRMKFNLLGLLYFL